MKRWMQILQVVVLSLCIVGCGIQNINQESETPIDYTVLQEDHIPDEIKDIIEKEKAEEFQMTYQSEDYLYILKGYGLQNMGGYSIAVDKLVLSGDRIICQTRLIGPDEQSQTKNEVSYPYLVIKTPYREVPVMFES